MLPPGTAILWKFLGIGITPSTPIMQSVEEYPTEYKDSVLEEIYYA